MVRHQCASDDSTRSMSVNDTDDEEMNHHSVEINRTLSTELFEKKTSTEFSSLIR